MVEQVCTLSDYQATNGHSIWLQTLPGAPSEEFIFDSNGGTLTIYDDGTANVQGRVIHESMPTWQWDVDIWLENKRNFADWTALGRGVKIDQAPPAVVAANQQDWFFWEMDSVKSKLTGVPSTFFDGDTLNLTHNPPDYQYGFQFGVGANAKNGNFGISGWFKYSGSYSGHGDINANASCGLPNCDVSISNVTPNCVTDSTFNVSVSIIGAGTNYEISDDQNSLAIGGLSAGTYNFGTYSSNTNVSIIVTDLDNAGCADTSAAVTTDCTPPPPVCDLTLVGGTPVCTSDSTFNISISFSGTGNTYQISDNQGSTAIIVNSSGTYTFGNYSNNTAVAIIVTDLNVPNCFIMTQAFTKDCTPPPPVCDIALIGGTPTCTSDSTFNVSISFSGTGSSYEISDNQGSTPTTVSGAGTYNFGSYSNNTSVAIIVTDLNAPNCFIMTQAFTLDCSPPPPVCDIALDSVAPACINDSTFNISISFSGTGTSYEISDNQGSATSTVTSAGTYTFGSYANNTAVVLTVTDLNAQNCSITTQTLTADCAPQVCQVAIDSLVAVCVNDSSFEVIVTFSGIGSNFQISDDQGTTPLTALSAGTYIFGNYFNSTDVTITVSDPSFPGCSATLGPVTADCTPPPCDVFINNVTANCIDDSTFEVAVQFFGTGSSFEIVDNQGSAPLFVGAAGTYTIGTYANNTSVSVVVTDLTQAACADTSQSVTADCTPQNCQVAIDSLVAECVNDSTFEVFVSFSGVGSNFQISDDQGSTPIGGFSPGTYSFGNYFNSTDVSITVSDPNFAGCSASFGPVTADCTPVPGCDPFTVDSTLTVCLTDSTWGVLVYINGPGLFYQISDNQGSPPLFGFPAGSYAYGNYPNNTAVNITVTDFTVFSCVNDTTFSITEDCSVGMFTEITELKAVNQGSNIRLSWIASREAGNRGFEIERSENGIDFQSIGWVDGAGSSRVARNYQFIDRKVVKNVNYTYRLKQISLNSRIRYSDIVEVISLNPYRTTLEMLYPNPASDETFVKINAGISQKMSCEIISADGKVLDYASQNLYPGEQEVSIDCSKLLPGVYILKFSLNEEPYQIRKLVISR